MDAVGGNTLNQEGGGTGYYFVGRLTNDYASATFAKTKKTLSLNHKEAITRGAAVSYNTRRGFKDQGFVYPFSSWPFLHDLSSSKDRGGPLFIFFLMFLPPFFYALMPGLDEFFKGRKEIFLRLGPRGLHYFTRPNVWTPLHTPEAGDGYTSSRDVNELFYQRRSNQFAEEWTRDVLINKVPEISFLLLVALESDEQLVRLDMNTNMVDEIIRWVQEM